MNNYSIMYKGQIVNGKLNFYDIEMIPFLPLKFTIEI